VTHVRLWQFEVSEGREVEFLAAYGSSGDWATLFSAAPGFLRTELWRNGDGIYLTADHWRSQQDFERFQAANGEDYRRLDRALEGMTLDETFIGAFDLVEG
jgi:heme-degrading monooxygenase HmoA